MIEVVKIREVEFPRKTVEYVINTINVALQEDTSGLVGEELKDAESRDWFVNNRDFADYLQDCLDKQTIEDVSISL